MGMRVPSRIKRGRIRLSALLAVVLVALLTPSADGAIVFKDRFGPPTVDGTEVGGLRDPQDVTVDTFGDIYVVDQHYHRVQKYDSNGKFIMSIGKPSTDGTYTQDGQLQHPQAIAISPDGSKLYVADTATHTCRSSRRPTVPSSSSGV